MEYNGNVALGVIRNQGKYLIMRRSTSNSSSGKWAFPGGKIRDQETPGEAVKREIREETDLNTEIQNSGKPYQDKGELGLWKIHPFLVTAKSREVRTNQEHDKYIWIDLERLGEMDTLGETKAPERLDLV
jgi:ADP-ribose pyrophosphatase